MAGWLKFERGLLLGNDDGGCCNANQPLINSRNPAIMTDDTKKKEDEYTPAGGCCCMLGVRGAADSKPTDRLWVVELSNFELLALGGWAGCGV